MYPEHVANFHTTDQDTGLYFSTMNEAQAIFTFSKLFKETKPNKQTKINQNHKQTNKSKREWAKHNILFISGRVGIKYLKNCPR